MNADRLSYLVTVLILVHVLAGCGTPAAPAPAPSAQKPAATTVLPSPAPTLPLPASASLSTSVPEAKAATIILTWWGQSTFVLKTSTGLNALLDPTSPGTGYSIPPQTGIDLITVSHEHSDHNAVNLAAGSPLVLRGLAGNDWAKIDQTVKGVRVRTVGVYHDDAQGSKRGKNAIFVFDVDGLRLAHLGDLGHLLSLEQIKDIGPVDVVLIPVGGYYTIDAKAAVEVVSQLNPKVVIPMHYKTPDLAASLAGVLDPVDDFIKAIGNTANVSQVGQSVTVEGQLPAGRTIMVMKYK
jgi:L-ascorbate metabolism protein UlaG (beta-lactamase superfamily)